MQIYLFKQLKFLFEQHFTLIKLSNMQFKIFLVVAFFLVKRSQEGIVPQIQVINDTASLVIEENVPFINNETLYVEQLFQRSVDFSKLNGTYSIEIQLLNYLANAITTDSNANLLMYQNAFKQAMSSSQAVTNMSFVQNAVNILHEQWNLNSFFLNHSLSIINVTMDQVSLAYQTNVDILRHSFFNQYFGTNFTVFII